MLFRSGLQMDQVKRLKDLELENRRLRRAVSDLTLDKLILGCEPACNFDPRLGGIGVEF